MLQPGSFGIRTLASPHDSPIPSLSYLAVCLALPQLAAEREHHRDTDFAFEPFLNLSLPEAAQSLGAVSCHHQPQKH